ncbi:hypothetical protein K503DRAFT_780972 [Rhizopogon vinicolor AM-OR11-026]|uniref:Uncharacterized protein n=1 Tax=Rhizopogon vinicolor AM-OR11-026 TaxID=1314800 RepID=A0A1B7N890_9AGAM|nr:hypothetical protein K503DRAFT_780972 [Rhizopogon vinicolor AM-OR11-026]
MLHSNFGEFLDEIRGLQFNETPSYDRWGRLFGGISERGESLPFDSAASHIAGKSSIKDFCSALESSRCRIRWQDPSNRVNTLGQLLPSTDSIVRPDQLIYVQLLPGISIEDYTVGQGDPSYWLDPSLSDQAWPTVPLPAVVLRLREVERELLSELTGRLNSYGKPVATNVRANDHFAGRCTRWVQTPSLAPPAGMRLTGSQSGNGLASSSQFTQGVWLIMGSRR